MGLEVMPLAAVWLSVWSQDLSYTVPSNNNRRETVTLLKDVCGCFEPGLMTAVVRALASCWGGGQQHRRMPVRLLFTHLAAPTVCLACG